MTLKCSECGKECDLIRREDHDGQCCECFSKDYPFTAFYCPFCDTREADRKKILKQQTKLVEFLK